VQQVQQGLLQQELQQVLQQLAWDLESEQLALQVLQQLGQPSLVP
jgi:hypothetical protein